MSYRLPDRTCIRQQIPKTQIYSKFGLSPDERRRFDSGIHRITVVNEISPRTVNIPEGKDIRSIFVLRVELQDRSFDEPSVRTIFKLIKQRMVLVLCHGDEAMVATEHGSLITGEWRPESSIQFELHGNDLDSVWEDLVMTIGSIHLEDGCSLEEQISENEHRKEIEKRIAVLESRMNKEKQPRRKYELFTQIHELREQLQ